jgi:GNAT superfamily N-acetyltransferase
MQINKFKIEEEYIQNIHITDDDIAECDINIYETGECLIHSLFVNKAYRRTGIGTQILSFVESFLYQRGYFTVDLYVNTNKHNFWLYRWYKKLGYQKSNEKCENGYLKMYKTLK